MNEALFFACGLVFGALVSASMLLLFGQWLLANGWMFMATPEEEQREDEARARERRVRALPPLSNGRKQR
jgi:hypothetical protein